MIEPITVVVNIKHTSEYDIYIGRPSVWGNPFVLTPHRTRREAIKKYEEYLRRSPELLGRLHELKGKRLGCYCAPAPCHGDVLARLADQEEVHEYGNTEI